MHAAITGMPSAEFSTFDASGESCMPGPWLELGLLLDEVSVDSFAVSIVSSSPVSWLGLVLVVVVVVEDALVPATVFAPVAAA